MGAETGTAAEGEGRGNGGKAEGAGGDRGPEEERGRTAKGRQKAETGRAVPERSGVVTRTIGALAGGKGTRRALAALVVRSTDVAFSRELAEIRMMPELLATKALGSGIFRLEILHHNPEVKQARKGTKRRFDIQVVGQNPERHKAPGASARIIGDRSPHLADGRDNKALLREPIHDVVGRSAHRKTTENGFRDIADHRIVSKELKVMGRSRARDGLVLVHGGSTNGDLGSTRNEERVLMEQRTDGRKDSISEAKGDRRDLGLKVQPRGSNRGSRRRERNVHRHGGKNLERVRDRRRKGKQRGMCLTSGARLLRGSKRSSILRRNFVASAFEKQDEAGEPILMNALTAERQSTRDREL